jgi:hypothetical protein
MYVACFCGHVYRDTTVCPRCEEGRQALLIPVYLHHDLSGRIFGDLRPAPLEAKKGPHSIAYLDPIALSEGASVGVDDTHRTSIKR